MEELYTGKVKIVVKPCRNCGRKFVPESLVKHEPACIDASKKKRKVFDSSKQRATEDLSLKQIKQAQKKPAAAPKSHWRQKHQEFIANVRAARGAQVAIDRGDPLPPPPPPSLNPDYVTCPYCSRRFNEKAAERHINFCKDQQKRLPAKREPTAEEKARAAARQKYAAQQKPKSRAPGGGLTSTPPSSGGGYSSTGGGYSSTGGGYSQSSGGGSYNSPAGRTTGSTRNTPASKTEVGRTPPGRAPPEATRGYGRGTPGTKTTATRGRPTGPAQPTYQANDYADNDFYDSPNGEFDGRIGSGRVLRTGRDVRTYEEAKHDMKGSNAIPRNKAAPMRGGMRGNPSAAKTKSSPGGYGTGYGGTKESESGYYSSSSENDIANNKVASSTSKFCHECGTMFPVAQARFCSECGIKRMTLR